MDVLRRLEVVQPPARESLADRVVVILKRMIILENLEPGSRMPPERRLADVLNVSRTVLREALGRLIGEGLLVRTSSRTIEVATFDRETLAASISFLDNRSVSSSDLMEFRYILEMGAIPIVVTRLTPDSLADIERWADESRRRLTAGESGIHADVNFHMALLRALGNPSVNSLLPLIEEQIRDYLLLDPHLLMGGSPEGAERVAGEHEELLAAITARDANRALEAMRRHLSPYLAMIREREREGSG